MGASDSTGGTGGGGPEAASPSITVKNQDIPGKPRKTKNCGFVLYPDRMINMYDSCQQTHPTSKGGRSYIVVSTELEHGSDLTAEPGEFGTTNVTKTTIHTWVITGAYCCSTTGGCSGIASVDNSSGKDTYWSFHADDCDEGDPKKFQFKY